MCNMIESSNHYLSVMNQLDIFILCALVFFISLVLIVFIRLIMKRAVKKLLIFFFVAGAGISICMLPYKKRIADRITLLRYHYHNRSNPPGKTILGGIQLKRDGYMEYHRPLAIKVTKNGFLKTHRDLLSKIKQGRIVDVEEGDGYFLMTGPNSSAHLTPLAKKRLIELGHLFRAHISNNENKKDYFIISSLTRTEAQQKIIRQLYPKQAAKGTSTHSYGVSFDISEMKSFGDSRVSLKALESALKQMQSDKKILLCPESTCIHVTVVK